MSRLRVALDVTSLIGAPTGIHQVTRGLMDALGEREDIDLHGWMLTARGAAPMIDIPVRRSRIPASLAVKGWTHSSLPPGRLIAGAADVVHGTNFLAPPSTSSVISLQDMTPLTHPEWCEPAVATMAGAIRNAVRRGATLHVSSEFVRQEALAEFGLPEERIRLVHHAITAAAGSADMGRQIAGGPYVLALGRVEKRKNIAAAVDALHGLPDDVRLVVAGPPGNDTEAVDAALGRHRPGRVVRLPHLSNRDRSSLVAGAELLLWPSLYEGFALPPLEALSMGTAVVATAVGALPELVGDAVDLIKAGDNEAFAAAVAAALDTAAEVPLDLRDRVSAHTWAEAAEGMVEIYSAVAST